jgi:hypothetical protein
MDCNFEKMAVKNDVNKMSASNIRTRVFGGGRMANLLLFICVSESGRWQELCLRLWMPLVRQPSWMEGQTLSPGDLQT